MHILPAVLNWSHLRNTNEFDWSKWTSGEKALTNCWNHSFFFSPPLLYIYYSLYPEARCTAAKNPIPLEHRSQFLFCFQFKSSNTFPIWCSCFLHSWENWTHTSLQSSSPPTFFTKSNCSETFFRYFIFSRVLYDTHKNPIYLTTHKHNTDLNLSLSLLYTFTFLEFVFSFLTV